jgi:hypothetical protein
LPASYYLNAFSSGHTFIDILKMDIEGSEFDALKFMINYYRDNGPLPFGQLQVEIHANKVTFVQFLKWWEELEEAGLRPFRTEVSSVCCAADSVLSSIWKPNLLFTNWVRNAPSEWKF